VLGCFLSRPASSFCITQYLLYFDFALLAALLSTNAGTNLSSGSRHDKQSIHETLMMHMEWSDERSGTFEKRYASSAEPFILLVYRRTAEHR
jgi:hypothetical protein